MLLTLDIMLHPITMDCPIMLAMFMLVVMPSLVMLLVMLVLFIQLVDIMESLIMLLVIIALFIPLSDLMPSLIIQQCQLLGDIMQSSILLPTPMVQVIMVLFTKLLDTTLEVMGHQPHTPTSMLSMMTIPSPTLTLPKALMVLG